MAKNFTPGWNDPPTLSYAPVNSTAVGNVRSLLNKRVAFPVNSNSSTGGSDNNITSTQYQPTAFVSNGQQSGAEVVGATNFHNAHNLVLAVNSNDLYHRSASTPCFSQPSENPSVQVPVGCFPFPAVHSSTPTSRQTPNIPDRAPTQYSNFEILAILTQAVEGCNAMTKSVRENVERKLAVLKTTLDSNGLSEPCRWKLCALVENLSTQRYNEAYSVHSAMMIDHFNEVNPWMVGVKAVVMDCLKR